MMAQDKDKEFFNTAEAAHFLGVSAEYIRRLTRQGKLPHSRIGKIILIKRRDLMAMVEVVEGKEQSDD